MYINEDWNLEKDQYNFILVNKKVSEAGNHTEIKYHYPTPEKALMALVDKRLDVSSVETMLRSLLETKADIWKALNKPSKKPIETPSNKKAREAQMDLDFQQKDKQ